MLNINTKRQLLALGLAISFISLPILALAENPANDDRPNIPRVTHIIKKKRKFVRFGLPISFISLPILALAENPANDDRPNMPSVREIMKKDKVKLFGEKAILRLTNALNRADGFRQRVAFHISQFPNPKFNPVLANQKLEEANTAIAEGRLAVIAIQTAMDTALAATGTESSFSNTRVKVREAMTAIRLAHQKIVEAIRLIKAGYPERPTATSTLSN